MRARSNDALADVPAQAGTEPEDAGHVPERTCVLTRAHGTRDALIRLALGPDGQVAPDVRARAPGRGAWIGVTQGQLETALAKGKLKGALSRAFKTGDLVIPADLPARTEAALRRTLLDRLGLGNAFDGMHDIHAMNYVPKPDPSAYAAICAVHGIDPARALFADDMARNLAPAKALGMTTLWIDNGSEQGPDLAEPDYVDYRSSDIAAWLAGILGEKVE